MPDQWYYAKNAQQVGPMPRQELLDLIANGTVRMDDLVWAEGMPQWLAVSQVSELTNQALNVVQANPSAIPLQPLSYAAPAPARPTSISIISILGMIFGSLKVLGSLCGSVAIIAMGSQLQTQGRLNIPMGWLIFATILGIVMGAFLLLASIGAYRLKLWARKGLVIYAILSIVFDLIGAAVNFHTLPGTSSGQSTSYALGMAVGSSCVGLVFPICILYFMTRPHVIAAFENADHTSTL